MTNFQKPALSDNDKIGIIKTLYGKSIEDLNKIRDDASTTLSDEREKRLKGEFGEEAKNAPTHKELEAGLTCVLVGEFIESRRKDDDFDPYKFLNVAEPAPKVA
jgi:hypothetical protein